MAKAKPSLFTVYYRAQVKEGETFFFIIQDGFTSYAAAENYIHEDILNSPKPLDRADYRVQLYANSPAPQTISESLQSLKLVG
jgi:hypothetical protein